MYSFATDIWSLGLAFLAVTTLGGSDADGIDASENATVRQHVISVLNQAPQKLPEHLDGALRGIISGCCLLDPKQRLQLYDVMQKLQEDLHQPTGEQKLDDFATFAHVDADTLVDAVRRGDFACVKELTSDKQYPVNAVTRSQWLPLLESIYCRKTQITQYLVCCKADVQKAAYQITPILLATLDGDLTMVDYLIQNNADVHTSTFPGTAALRNACLDNDLTRVKSIVTAGVSPYAETTDGGTPMAVTKRESRRYIEAFKQLGPFRDDATILMWAAYYDKVDVVKKLMFYDVNTALKDSENKTALDYALDQGNVEIANIIKNKKVSPLQATFFDYSKLENVEKLGQGQFGDTFRCVLKVGEAEIAAVAKVSKLGAGTDEWRELEVLKVIPPHDSVLGLLGIIMDFQYNGNDAVAILVPLMRGGSLETYIKQVIRQGLPLRIVLQFTLHMASSIAHLHENGYVHCDIAQRNFLLKYSDMDHPEQRLVVADFGLSRRLEKNFANLGPKEKVPIAAIAPEVLHSPYRYFRKSDVWQVGLAIWEFLRYPLGAYPDCHGVADILDLLKREMSVKKGKIPINFRKRKSLAQDTYDVICELCEFCCVYDIAERPSARDLEAKILTMLPDDAPLVVQKDRVVGDEKVDYGNSIASGHGHAYQSLPKSDDDGKVSAAEVDYGDSAAGKYQTLEKQESDEAKIEVDYGDASGDIYETLHKSQGAEGTGGAEGPDDVDYGGNVADEHGEAYQSLKGSTYDTEVGTAAVDSYDDAATSETQNRSQDSEHHESTG